MPDLTYSFFLCSWELLKQWSHRVYHKNSFIDRGRENSFSSYCRWGSSHSIHWFLDKSDYWENEKWWDEHKHTRIDSDCTCIGFLQTELLWFGHLGVVNWHSSSEVIVFTGVAPDSHWYKWDQNEAHGMYFRAVSHVWYIFNDEIRCHWMQIRTEV